jgi:hypothetical protein
MATPLSPPLKDIRTQLEAASLRAQNIVAGLPASVLMQRPAPNSWSIAECLGHLTLTAEAYEPVIRQGIDEGRRKRLFKSGDQFRMEWNAKLLAWWLEPPYRLKSRTPIAFVPIVQDPANALPEFLYWQQRVMELLAAAEGLALDRIRIVSPVSSRMRYNVYAAFQLIAVHERRHLWQAEQVLRKKGVEEQRGSQPA